jgi:glycerol-3-phosphate O-acyltransferase/dihydroxyacetone phosphate acyltransferase
MARRLITLILRAAARIFFRRIEIVGTVPDDAPVIFAVNHPNALIDPLFLLCFAPRPVSFLGKEPLLRMPVIGWIARAFDTIPVYRKQDAANPADNKHMFAKARAVLQRGGAIAIFPEGTTHSDPKLRELKTGAARIALGASIRVLVVPAGLYYTSKQTFRSSALMLLGEPIVVDSKSAEEPPPSLVEPLTEQIEKALADVTLQADSHEALELIELAERIFSAGTRRSLAEELELRQRFVDGYAYLCERDPARVARLAAAIREIDPPPRRTSIRAVYLLLLPFGIAGAIIHWPVYRLIDLIARRADRETEATVKLLAGALFYPLFWIAIAFFTRWYAVLILPILGYCALMSIETIERLRARHPDVTAIRDEIVRIAEEITARQDRATSAPEAVTSPSPRG